MKYLPIAIFILLLSCKQKSTTKTNTPAGDSTETLYTLYDEEMPSHFLKDSVIIKDSTLNLEAFIFYAFPPSGPFAREYSQLIKDSISHALTDFKSGIATYLAEDDTDPDLPYDESAVNSFGAGPLNCYADDLIISSRYNISSLSAGANHGFNGLISFNMDRKTGKLINAHDYFQLDNSENKKTLVSLLDNDFKELRIYDEQDSMGETFYNLNNINFVIQKDAIIFSFSDYALGQGHTMLATKIPKQRLTSLINKKYQ